MAAAPPLGTAQRIRTRAIWAGAFFAASVPPALIGFARTGGTMEEAAPLALVFWGLGALFALGAAVPTLRHWDQLPDAVRWLGAAPMLTVSFLLSAALVAALIA
ncbi:MAG: hypothetical protein FJX02_11075 [Alphaproteobacteria bacterium]|nr:hypothetical protein [Alphaproteobacteria bacterium]